ncbi:MAG: hypothetical protein Q9209_007247 [Squamulea sp. 1 TL-2023]
MAETAAAFLFNELLLTPWTLGRFRDKRSLQTVHRHVRNVVFYDAVLPMVTLEEWMEVNTWQMSPFWPPYEIHTHFNQYQILHNQQERNLKEFRGGGVVGGLFDQIKDTLRSLRCLTVATDDYGSWPSHLQVTKYPSLYGWSEVWHDICSLGLRDTERQAADIFRAWLGFIADNIAQSHTRLTTLAVGNMPYSFHNFLGNLVVGKSPPALALFKSLIYINIDLKFCSHLKEQDSSLKLLGECLSAANSVEELRLDVHVCQPYGWHTHPDILANLSLTTRRLRFLQLCQMHTTALSLHLLLGKHYETLETLEIQDLWLVDDGRSLHEDGLGLMLQTLAAQMHVEWIYINCTKDPPYMNSEDSRCCITMNTDYGWDVGIRVGDIKEFCDMVSNWHFTRPAISYLGFKAERYIHIT